MATALVIRVPFGLGPGADDTSTCREIVQMAQVARGSV